MTNQVYLYYGNDEYLVDTKAKEQVEKICPPEEQSLALEVVHGNVDTIDSALATIDHCIAAFRTVGLFGGKKVVWFRNVSFLNSAVIMRNERVKGLLQSLASDLKAGLAANQFLLISASGVDKRSVFFKALNTTGKVFEFIISERDYEARPIAVRKAKALFNERGYQIDSATVEVFVDKVGFETRQIINEVEKLTLYKGEKERTILLEDVQVITSSSHEAIIWDFADAVVEQRLSEAIRIFRQLLVQKQSVIGLMIQLENKFAELLQFREFLQAGWVRMNGTRIEWKKSSEIDAYFSKMDKDARKIHWFRASKLLQQAQRYSASGLMIREKWVLDIHERMISEGSLAHDLLAETLIAKLCASRLRKK